LSKNETIFEDFIHPKAYVNKLLFSGYDSDESGCLQLWNIMSGEMIFDFK
jgi:hypothetical protein